MRVNGITNAGIMYASEATTKSKSKDVKQTGLEKQENNTKGALIYEKNEQTVAKKAGYQKDNATVKRMMEEAKRREKNLKDLVEKILLKQGKIFNSSADIYTSLREGRLKVDAKTQKQAQEDIAEDGYWGVEQTSQRLVSFAKALSGGDPSKADELIAAVKKGYEQAEKTWGGKLPEISSKTLDSAISKLEKWRDEL
jgi:hypothetical protein